MKILYCHDNVYYKDDQEHHFSAGQFGYDYWQPYLEAFGSLTVLGRGESLPTNADMRKMSRSDGQNVEIKTFSNINSPLALLEHRKHVASAIISEVNNFMEIYKYLNSLKITTEIKNPKELSQSLIEDFKSDIKKNDEIINKINNYGLNILNNVIKEIKIYINT